MNFLLVVIAFNHGRSIFYNLRYFEQIYADQFKQNFQAPTSSPISFDSIQYEIVNFYFIVTCHELAHNIESNHNSYFNSHLQGLAVHYMSKKERFFLERFSLKK